MDDIREGSHAETLDHENFVSNQERDWLRWVADVERGLGCSLDGDQDVDGFSLGFAYEAWKGGKPAARYVADIRRMKA